jgi:Family of unknown function (DUF5304)
MSADGEKPAGGDQADLGSIADEAAKLVEAVQNWARGVGAESGSAAGPLAEFLAAGAGGSPSCRFCPVCQLVSTVREVRPETVQDLLEVGTSLLASMRTLIERQEREWSSRPAAPVQHIDIDEPDIDEPDIN